jgi:autoinducer 2-degrading protein
MSKIALVVEYRVKPDHREAFLRLMREHAAGTLVEEAGCLQFDVLLPQEDASRVFLYEVYRDDAAFQEHNKSARLAQTRGSYADMLEHRTITVCTVG